MQSDFFFRFECYFNALFNFCEYFHPSIISRHPPRGDQPNNMYFLYVPFTTNFNTFQSLDRFQIPKLRPTALSETVKYTSVAKSTCIHNELINIYTTCCLQECSSVYKQIAHAMDSRRRVCVCNWTRWKKYWSSFRTKAVSEWSWLSSQTIIHTIILIIILCGKRQMDMSSRRYRLAMTCTRIWK